VRPDETDDKLPPTQRRGRNAWDAIAEIARILGRGIGAIGSGIGAAVNKAVTPGGIFLIVLILIVVGVLNTDTLSTLVDLISDILDKVKR